MAKIIDLDVMQKSRRFFTGLVMLLVGGVIGFALPHHSAATESQTGTVSAVVKGSGGAATMFTFSPSGGGQPIRLWAPPVWQAAPDGPWQTTGVAPCLATGKTVTLGLIDASTTSSAPSNWVVTSVTCNAP